MATFGQVREYQLECESISAYLECVQLFFQANDIGEAKHIAVLLSVIGGKTYSLLRSLLAPAKPQEKSFAQLVEVLRQHC